MCLGETVTYVLEHSRATNPMHRHRPLRETGLRPVVYLGMTCGPQARVTYEWAGACLDAPAMAMLVPWRYRKKLYRLGTAS
jgi:hypothetical protein